MKKIRLLVVALFLTLSCNAQKSVNIKNTKWVYDFGGGYKSCYLFFEDGKYEYHDAEVGEILKGTFEQKKDTIIIFQESGQYDDDFPEGSRHRTEKKEFILLIRNKKELGLDFYWDQDKNKWKNEAFVFIKE